MFTKEWNSKKSLNSQKCSCVESIWSSDSLRKNKISTIWLVWDCFLTLNTNNTFNYDYNCEYKSRWVTSVFIYHLFLRSWFALLLGLWSSLRVCISWSREAVLSCRTIISSYTTSALAKSLCRIVERVACLHSLILRLFGGKTVVLLSKISLTSIHTNILFVPLDIWFGEAFVCWRLVSTIFIVFSFSSKSWSINVCHISSFKAHFYLF